MSRLIEIIRRIVQQEIARERGNRLGVVTAVFPHEAEDDANNHEVNVRLKHEDLELRRVPIAVGHVGLAAPPRTDDLVLVAFVDGDLNQPVITGRFYHADDRPPLHRENEILFEQRVPDGTLNHLRFTDDGTIYLQRDVTKPEDNSEAKATIRIDGASGDIEIKTANDQKAGILLAGDSGTITITSGEKIAITLTHDDNIQITADGQPITIDCDGLTINSNVDINGDLTVASSSGSTTISGHEIQGA
ncbi:MAG TPA: phage baseplate assembly protein V [Dehalococcoidia bacterium]|nr:phage baseplate assembly protein V [Dehalococcoidia bacterium]